MDKVFICSPYRGDTVTNSLNAENYCRDAALEGLLPIAPHLYFTRFLNDDFENEREQGIAFGVGLLKECKEIWVCGNVISEGMAKEIEVAKELGIKIVNKYG